MSGRFRASIRLVAEGELLVDGEPVDLIDTIILRQEKPLPGGHEYRLTLRGRTRSGFDRFVAYLPERQWDVGTVFGAVTLITARLPGEGQIPARYILNTVDQLIRDGDQVTVLGGCSIPTAW